MTPSQKTKKHTPLQTLNYNYARRKRTVAGTLSMAANLLDSYAWPKAAQEIRVIKDIILRTLNTQYAADKKFIQKEQANLTNTNKPT